MDDEKRKALTVAQMARLLDCPEEVVLTLPWLKPRDSCELGLLRLGH